MAQIPTAARVNAGAPQRLAPSAATAMPVASPSRGGAVAAPAKAEVVAAPPAGQPAPAPGAPTTAAPTAKQLLAHWEESSVLDADSSAAVAQLHIIMSGRESEGMALRNGKHEDASKQQQQQAQAAAIHASTRAVTLLERLAQRESDTALRSFASSRADAGALALPDSARPASATPSPSRSALPALPAGFSHAALLSLLMCAQLYTTTPASLAHLTPEQAVGAERSLVEAGFPVQAHKSSPAGAAAAGGLSPHQRHLLYFLQLRSASASLQSLLSSTTALQSSSQSLLSLFHAVFSQTNRVREECSALLAEQQSLAADTLAFNYHLSYFIEIESIQSKMQENPLLREFMREHAEVFEGQAAARAAIAAGAGSNQQGFAGGSGSGSTPALSLVLHQQSLAARNPMLAPEFPHLLSSLDACLDYLRANADFLEAAHTRLRYEKLHAGVLRAIRNYVAASMEAAVRRGVQEAKHMQQGATATPPATAAGPSKAEDPKSDASGGSGAYHGSSVRMQVLIQLRTLAHSLKPLILEMEHRAFAHEGGIFGAGMASPSGTAAAGQGGATGPDGLPSTQPAYYKELLMECYRLYAANRHAQLFGELQSHLSSLLSQPQRSLPSLIRSACVSWIDMCLSESHLFAEFFSPNAFSLAVRNELLASFCGEILYSQLRPAVIRSLELDNLVEMATVIQGEIMQEQVRNRGGNGVGNRNAGGKGTTPPALAASSSSSSSSSSSAASASGSSASSPPSSTLELHSSSPLYSFSLSVQRLLADVQERLIHRAQLYIRDAIQHYPSTKEDLNYPAKLIQDEAASDATAGVGASTEAQDPATAMSLSLPVASAAPSRRIGGGALLSQWHPVLERTLLLLSKLYRCVEPSVFRYLATEAVSVCVSTLLECANKITEMHAGAVSASPNASASSPRSRSSPDLCDGLLFSISHLLVLREQLSPFSGVDLSVTTSELDFSHMKDVLPNLFSSVGKWSSFMELVHTSAPRSRETKQDSKKHLESQLKLACEQLIASQTQVLLGPLLAFFTRMGAAQQEGAGSQGPAHFKAELVALMQAMTGRAPPNPGEAPPLTSASGEGPNASVSPPPSASASASPFSLHLHALLRHTSLYLRHAPTERLLLRPIQRSLAEVCQQLAFFVHTHFDREEEEQGPAAGNGERDASAGATSASASSQPSTGVSMSTEAALTRYLHDSIRQLEASVAHAFRE